MSAVPHTLSALRLFRRTGRVTRVTDLAIESHGPAVVLGEVCEISSPAGDTITAEVVAMQGDSITLLPYGACKGIAVGAAVEALGVQPSVDVGEALLGQVVDAFGRTLQGPALAGAMRRMPLYAEPLNPMDRAAITATLDTGVRVIDGVLPLGRGQRLGIFAGSGVGKSSLMGMLASNVAADVAVVALIGERGREVQEFVEHRLGPDARARTVVVTATADQPAVVRARAAHAATSIAEYFRDTGRHVLLVMDSVTRFAMARREIDLAAGQPPTARGYTPSVFSAIPALCERCGGLRRGGSITALYTVLVEGDDVNEPVADALRATLDGHIVLSRDLANEGHYPAIDVLHSVSRLEGDLLSAEELQRARELRTLLSVHRRQREMVDMGLYKPGSNSQLDLALAKWPEITGFLRQSTQESSTRLETQKRLAAAIAPGASA